MLIVQDNGKVNSPSTEIQQYVVTPTNATPLTLEVGKKYLVLVWGSWNTVHSPTTYDGTTFTNCEYRKVSNFYTGNDYMAGTYFEVVPTNTSVGVSQSVAGVVTVIFADIG